MTTMVRSSDQEPRDPSAYDNKSRPFGATADVVFCDDGPNGGCVGPMFPGLSVPGEMILLHRVRDADRDREDEGEACANKTLRESSSSGTKTRFFRATAKAHLGPNDNDVPKASEIPTDSEITDHHPGELSEFADPRGAPTHSWGSNEPPVDEIVRRPYGRRLGVTKWFSDRLGYGFITDISGPDKGVDLFTHFTSIRPLNNTRRTLHKGEYVSFDVGANCGGVQAVFVTGVLGGPLMCDQNE